MSLSKFDSKKKQSFFKKEGKIRKYTNLNRAPNADSSWSSAVKLRNALKILFYYKFNIKYIVAEVYNEERKGQWRHTIGKQRNVSKQEIMVDIFAI